MKDKLIRGIKKLKWITNDGLYSTGLLSLKLSSQERRILIYHGVTNNARTDINARFISTALFEKQIRFFKKNFNIVNLNDYFAGAHHSKKLTIAITFDDGYLNNLTEVLPVLEKYQVPTTFFITTIGKANYDVLWADLLDLYRLTGPKSFTFKSEVYKRGKHEYTGPKGSLKALIKNSGWSIKKELIDVILAENQFINNPQSFTYFKLLNKKQIQQLARSEYANIGSHGLYHNCLDKIPLAEAKDELIKSKAYIEDLIQMDVASIAYPDGRYTPEVVDLAEKIGYTQQLAVDYIYEKDDQDQRIQKRFGINPFISFNNQIQAIIDEKY